MNFSAFLQIVYLSQFMYLATLDRDLSLGLVTVTSPAQNNSSILMAAPVSSAGLGVPALGSRDGGNLFFHTVMP